MRAVHAVMPPGCLLLCSCAGALSGHPGFNATGLLPPRAAATVAVAGTTPKPGLPKSCAAFDDPPAGAASATKEARNACLADLQTIIDQSYRAYELNLSRQVAGTNFLLNVGTLGVTTAGTVTGSEATKTILSAIATGLTGVRTAISQDILLKASVQTLILQMRADRASIGTRIETRRRADLPDYTMADVRRDLVDYYYAGTITNALASNNAQTGADAKSCEDAQAKALEGTGGAAGSSCYAVEATYTFGEPGERLEAILNAKDGSVPSGTDRIKTCMRDLKLGYTTMFLTYGAPEADKNRVLGCYDTAVTKEN